MRVALDCTLVPGNRAGIGQYCYSLAHALSKADGADSYLFYVLAPLAGRAPATALGLPEGARFATVVRRTPLPMQLMGFLDRPGLSWAVREYGLGGLDADIVHSTSFAVPRFRGARKRVVATIYDTSTVTHPECHTRVNAAHCTKGIRDAVAHADAIIAISEHTKRDIIEHFNAPEGLITVTQLAAGAAYRPVKDGKALAAVRARYGIEGGYILFVGSLEPRKNVKRLLEAYSILPERLRREYRLVVAGGRGWLNSEIPGLVEGLGIRERVAFPGYVAEGDMAALYSAAALFAYPSLYEGFGLPILEAMSCGAPVVTSNVSSMPEVAGDSAVLVDPRDPEAIAAAMTAILEDAGLGARLRAAGPERAALFSWERCARETLEVYAKVMERPKRR